MLVKEKPIIGPCNDCIPRFSFQRIQKLGEAHVCEFKAVLTLSQLTTVHTNTQLSPGYVERGAAVFTQVHSSTSSVRQSGFSTASGMLPYFFLLQRQTEDKTSFLRIVGRLPELMLGSPLLPFTPRYRFSPQLWEESLAHAGW